MPARKTTTPVDEGTAGVLDSSIKTAAEIEKPEDVDFGFSDLDSAPATFREHDNVDYAALAKLREEFPAGQVGLLPRGVKKDDKEKFQCRPGTQASADGKFCGGHHVRSVHLDFVGHAALTNRFLDADPTWSWEPMAYDDAGLPALDRFGGMWIKLTIGGVTRPGYGDAQGKPAGTTAIKEIIGDALRNAGMRFGGALNLWHKGDLFENAVEQGKVAAETGPAASAQRRQSAPRATAPAPEAQPPAQPAPAPQQAAQQPQQTEGHPTPFPSGPTITPPDGWKTDVAFAKTVADLGALYKRADAEGWWSEEVSAAFTVRRKQIEAEAGGAAVQGAFQHPEQ